MKQKKPLTFIITIAGILLVLSLIILPKTVLAKKKANREKYITTIKIKEGDTLWGIAQDYITKEYHSVKQYISEIKRTNNLTTDTIYEDCYLIIPYYNASQ